MRDIIQRNFRFIYNELRHHQGFEDRDSYIFHTAPSLSQIRAKSLRGNKCRRNKQKAQDIISPRSATVDAWRRAYELAFLPPTGKPPNLFLWQERQSGLSRLTGQCSHSGMKALGEWCRVKFGLTREKPRERKHNFRLHSHLHPGFPGHELASEAAAPKPREAPLPTSHPRGYFYCTKRLLEAAVAAAGAGEASLQRHRALNRGPTSAASSPFRPPSCIPQSPPLCAACSSSQGCPHISFADSLRRTPSTSRFSFHILQREE